MLIATTTCLIPSRCAIVEWRLVCGRIPWRASTMTTASCAVEAPVTMFRVYCTWPGVSAMMNLRRLVEKYR